MDRGLDPGVAHKPLDERDAFTLVPGGVGGVEADQPLQELGGALVEPLGVAVRDRHADGCCVKYSEMPVPRRPSHSYSGRPSFTWVRRPSRRWRKGATSTAGPLSGAWRPSASRARTTNERWHPSRVSSSESVSQLS